jgi:hypothetical protein
MIFQWTVLLLLSPLMLAAPPVGYPPDPGDLVITEIMVDPDATRDSSGEYVEVTNVSERPLQLLGLIIRDDGHDWCPVVRPLLVPAGRAIVFARKWEPSLNGGFFPAYLCTGHALHLKNDRDTLVLDWYGVDIDEVGYVRREWPLEPGKSMELDRALYDSSLNDEPSAWAPSRTPMASGDFGTPGQ